MTLTKTGGLSKAGSSNKPPAPPTKAPDQALFVQSVALEDGRTLWISLPLPDRLTIVSYFFPSNFTGGAGLDHNVFGFAEELAASQVVFGKTGGSGLFKPQGNLIAIADLALGERESSVRIEVRRSTNKDAPLPDFSLRLECNPRKLGPQGFDQLLGVLQQAGQASLQIDQLFGQAKLTRLDVAIDVAGITPGELLLRVKEKSKRVSYRSADSHLETVQLHREKANPAKPTKPRAALGKLQVKAYDRNRQKAGVGKPAPFPGHDVTRLEIVKNRFAPKVSGLADLPTLVDQFAHISARDRDTANPLASLDQWRAYVSCRDAMGHVEAAASLHLDKAAAKECDLAFQGAKAASLLSDTWKGWNAGLKRTGLTTLIDLAKPAAASIHDE